MSALQHALQNGEQVESIQARLGVKVRRHPRHPNLVLFVYDQIESPKGDSVVRASRGHILDEANGWAHVARPFDRFFNEGEGTADVVDITQSRCYLKEDGSKLSLWHYQGEWHVSTKGSPSAGGMVGDFPFTFVELFWRVWHKHGYTLPTDTSKTYVFELCTLYNRVVVPQPEERLVLLAVRSNESGREDDPMIYKDQWVVAESYNLASLAEIRDTFQSLPALHNEGYVVAQYLDDGSVRRIKVKHPGYLALSKLKEGITVRSLLELKRTGEEGEFLAVFPEYSERFHEISSVFDAFVSRMETLWEKTSPIEGQKDFALAIKDVPGSACLFQVRKSGVSIRTVLAGMHIDALVRTLGLRADSKVSTED